MVTECWAIVIVILAMCYIFLRARKPEYSIGILPLILVPLSHLLGTGILYWFGDHITLDHSLVGIGIDVTGLVITCVLLGFAVQAIKSRKQRNCPFGLLHRVYADPGLGAAFERRQMTGGQNRERRAGLDIVVDIHGMRAFAAKTYLQHLLARASLDGTQRKSSWFTATIRGLRCGTWCAKNCAALISRSGIPAFRTGRRFWCLKSGYLPPAEAACQKCA